MNESLLEVLVDPISGQPLAVEIGRVANDDIVEGTLETAAHDRKYRISNGIPRLVLSEDRDQQITTESFAYKWARRETYDSPEVRSALIDWMCLRHGFADVSRMRSYVASHRRILDAGCGSALSSSFCMEECWADDSGCEWYGLEISGAIGRAGPYRAGTAPSLYPRRHPGALSDLHAEVELDEPIPYLGIPAGKHDVQRLVYWHMLNLFWNPDFDFETNNHINFDWHAPRYAHRQTEADLRRWCAESDMEVEYLDDSDQARLTLHARKP